MNWDIINAATFWSSKHSEKQTGGNHEYDNSNMIPMWKSLISIVFALRCHRCSAGESIVAGAPGVLISKNFGGFRWFWKLQLGGEDLRSKWVFSAMPSFLFEREVFVNGKSPVTLSTAQAMFPTIDADLIRHLDSAEHSAWVQSKVWPGWNKKERVCGKRSNQSPKSKPRNILFIKQLTMSTSLFCFLFLSLTQKGIVFSCFFFCWKIRGKGVLHAEAQTPQQAGETLLALADAATEVGPWGDDLA